LEPRPDAVKIAVDDIPIDHGLRGPVGAWSRRESVRDTGCAYRERDANNDSEKEAQ
jgi:hypothetical protein